MIWSLSRLMFWIKLTCRMGTCEHVQYIARAKGISRQRFSIFPSSTQIESTVLAQADSTTASESNSLTLPSDASCLHRLDWAMLTVHPLQTSAASTPSFVFTQVKLGCQQHRISSLSVRRDRRRNRAQSACQVKDFCFALGSDPSQMPVL